MLEKKGYLESTKYYSKMISSEKSKISTLEKEYKDLVRAQQVGVDNGFIAKYSEAWYEMQDAINGVKEQIDEATLSVVEYQNKIREIKWDRFTYLQDEISKVVDESNFLISLMGYSDMYDENGKRTDEGTATVGLHAMNYNVPNR